MKVYYLIPLLFLSACNKPEKKDYFCDSFILHLDSRQNIENTYFKMCPEKNDGRKILGFAKIDKNEIWVSYSLEVDKDGEPLPNMENFGHEMWHLIKGNFHK